MNLKGQEAAVFELLIAVILMGFVIIVGMSALDSLNKQKAEGELSQNLNELKHAIEIASAGRNQQEIVISFPNTFPSNKSVLRLINSDKKFECTNICKEQRTHCMFLDFKLYDSVVFDYLSPPTYVMYSKRICLDINPFTDFTGSSDDKRSGFNLISWGDEEKIIPGRYLLVNSSDFFTAVPKVNVYEYVGGS
jgi:type II secretory pathway pseudopilin PulG